MSVLQKFIYTWPEGATPINFNPWTTTLTQAEQDEFTQADNRQKQFRQQAIDDGLLALVPGVGYEWKDQDTFARSKPFDPTWLIYWERWIKETGVKFSYSILEK